MLSWGKILGWSIKYSKLRENFEKVLQFEGSDSDEKLLQKGDGIN
jgi:hypothetical protein